MRTFSRSDWDEAQTLWLDFSDEWKSVRHQAAMRGILFPPSGTCWDSWEDDSPSQRAILIRAIREQSRLLAECVAHARSWSEVISRLVRKRDDWREEMAHREAEAARVRREEQPPRREALMSIAQIMARVADSAGIDR